MDGKIYRDNPAKRVTAMSIYLGDDRTLHIIDSGDHVLSGERDNDLGYSHSAIGD